MLTTSRPLELAIQTLSEAIKLTPASAAQDIISESSGIFQIINADKNGREDEKNLALKILDIAVVISNGLRKLDENACKDADIERICNHLSGRLESMSKAINNKPQGGFFARLLTQSSARQRIKGWLMDLDHIESLLTTQIQLQIVKMSQAISVGSENAVVLGSNEERILQANQEALDLIKSEVLKQLIWTLPPAASGNFYGRSQQVEHLVESLVHVPEYHAILGPGGMGKTSVGLNVLHNARIMEVYGNHRYFLACDTIMDASGIIAGLADIFSLKEHTFMKEFRRFCKVIQSNVLFLLDNFETPWERKEARQQVEDLLTDLSSIRNLSIVITLRGAERPLGIQWSSPMLPALGPVELSAARQIFITISGAEDDDDDMNTLLEEVECIPLAVTLLAAQASCANCALLLERWHTSKTSMITRGWDSRLSSLDVSISVTLTSSRFTSNPHALYVLQILSLLPDGATVGQLREMTTDGPDIYSSVSTLLQVALANTDIRNRVRLLGPIREYVRSKHPISHSHFQCVFAYHAELARYASVAKYTAEEVNMDERLQTCIGNIHHVIWYSLHVEPLKNEAIDATINVATFRRLSNSGSISQLLEQSVKIARATQNLVLLAACLRELAVRIQLTSYDGQVTADALLYLEESANILRLRCHSSPGCFSKSCTLVLWTRGAFRRFSALFGSSRRSGNNQEQPPSSQSTRRPRSEGLDLLKCSDLLVTTLSDISWNMATQERLEEAMQVSQEAVKLISPSTSPVTSALAYMCLSRCQMSLHCNYSQCWESLKRAGSYFNPGSYPVLSLRLLCHTSQMYHIRHMYSQAIEEVTTGLSFRSLSESERAHLLVNRALLYIHTCRYEDARRDSHEAIRSLASFGQTTFMSLAYNKLGISYLACGNFGEAAGFFHAAHQFLHADTTRHPSLVLAALELYQNHLEQALVYLNSVPKEIALFRKISDSCLYRLQIQCQIQIRQGRAVDSMSSCISASIIAHRKQDRNQVALSLLWLGDAFFFIQKDLSTSRACYHYFLDLVRYLGGRRLIASALLRIGVTDYIQGDSSLAVRRLNQAVRLYEETEGGMWAEFCREILRLIGGGVHHENIPFFPPVVLDGF